MTQPHGNVCLTALSCMHLSDVPLPLTRCQLEPALVVVCLSVRAAHRVEHKGAGVLALAAGGLAVRCAHADPAKGADTLVATAWNGRGIRAKFAQIL